MYVCVKLNREPLKICNKFFTITMQMTSYPEILKKIDPFKVIIINKYICTIELLSIHAVL